MQANQHEVGFAYGRAVGAFIDWLKSRSWFSPSPEIAARVRAEIHTAKMRTLKIILKEPYKSYDELSLKIIKFYKELLQFQRDNSTVSTEIFDIIKAANGLESAVYVAANAEILALMGQLSQSDHTDETHRSYKSMLQRIAGNHKVSPSEDLKQLQLAQQVRNRLSENGRTWSIKVSEETLRLLATTAAHSCNNQGECDNTTASERMRLLAEIYPPRLVEAVGGLQQLLNLSVLADIHIGMTGYLDETRPIEMHRRIMRGVDELGRPLAFCYIFRGQEQVEVIFQRYTDEIANWVSGICCNRSPLFMASGSVNGIDHVPDSRSRDGIQIIADLNHGAVTVDK